MYLDRVKPLAIKSSRPIVTWHTYDCDRKRQRRRRWWWGEEKGAAPLSKYLSIRKRISLSSGRDSRDRCTKRTRTHARSYTLAYGTNTMRGNDGSRSPRVTEYSSMCFLSAILLRNIRATTRGESTRFFLHIFHPPFLSSSSFFSSVTAPICTLLRDKRTAPRSSRFIKLQGGSTLRTLPVSRARDRFDFPENPERRTWLPPESLFHAPPGTVDDPISRHRARVHRVYPPPRPIPT